MPASGEPAGSGRVARVTVSLDGDKLSVVVHNEFTDRPLTAARRNLTRCSEAALQSLCDNRADHKRSDR